VIPKDDLGYPIAGWEELLDRANAAEAKVAELEATIERLTKIGHASLREYGRHATECHWWATCRDGDCTCGFLNCIAALSKQVHP
jgi:hypothetical protein